MQGNEEFTEYLSQLSNGRVSNTDTVFLFENPDLFGNPVIALLNI